MSINFNIENLKIGNSHIRPRRLRRTEGIRNLVQENNIQKNDLIYPIFVSEKGTQKFDIPSLPGISRLPFDNLVNEVKYLQEIGIQAIMLFPVIDKTKKDPFGKESYNPNGLMQNCIRLLKKEFPKILVFVDVALDPYTTHGHDGIINESSEILNEETVAALCKQSLSYAECGVDFVCPSDMMDGRIGAIRHVLDQNNYINTGILAYSAKYASAFYGPFREAISSGARGLDKKTYQLNPSNSREGLREALLDIDEGADMVMIKPGLPYLDIVSKIKSESQVPVVVYQVSGEYAMLKFGALNNLFDEEKAVFESLISMKRAGADLIVTYYAKWLCENKLT